MSPTQVIETTEQPQKRIATPPVLDKLNIDDIVDIWNSNTAVRSAYQKRRPPSIQTGRTLVSVNMERSPFAVKRSASS